MQKKGLLTSVLAGLGAIGSASGLDELAAKSATPQRVTGRYKHNRGPFTRDRKSRGRNPKKRMRQEMRAMRKRLGQDPNLNTFPGLYLALAVERPPWRNRRPEVYAKAYIMADASPTERAASMFREEFAITQPFAVQLRRVWVGKEPDPRDILVLDDPLNILHDEDIRDPMPMSMRAA